MGKASIFGNISNKLASANRTCDESSEQQDSGGDHEVSADDEPGEEERVDEAALVVDRAAVVGLPEAKVVAEVLRHKVWRDN